MYVDVLNNAAFMYSYNFRFFF